MNEYELQSHLINIVGAALFSDQMEATDGGLKIGPQPGHDKPNYKNCRMDIEIEYEKFETWISDEDRVKAVLLTRIVLDLFDLYWHGDVNSSDPLLKSVDGFAKNPNRGTPTFTNVIMNRRLNPQKDVMEYTLFFHVST